MYFLVRYLRVELRPHYAESDTEGTLECCGSTSGSSPFSVRYADVLMLVRLATGGHVYEVQLHLAPMLKAKENGHLAFEWRRRLVTPGPPGTRVSGNRCVCGVERGR